MPAETPATAPREGRGPSADDTAEQCGDLIAGYDEDGPTAYECGAVVRRTETGHRCERGHAYTYAAYREAEGWDYASDPVEAELLSRAGVLGAPPGDDRPRP
ncbi:hypothetical protein [Streptomyces sp. NPDC059802]|uniref:hypothetical protein n=1 Tax=Streptomyces sp. NPDC059802 TaxID=3346952 RepID=UPI00364B4650